MQSLRGALQLCKSKQQFVRSSERDGPLRDKIAPDPVMMTNDADGVEVRAVAHRMAVGNDNNVVMICDRGSDSRINAEISCPSGDQDPIRRDLLEARLQVRPAERIVEGLLNNNISGISSQIGKKRPARRLRLEIATLAAAMLDKDHRAGLFADLGREPVDAFDDAGQIVLGLPIEESDLHIDDKHCVHEGAGKKRGAVRFQAPVYPASKIKTTGGRHVHADTKWQHMVIAWLRFMAGWLRCLARNVYSISFRRSVGYRRPVSGATLAEALGISLRTVYRDIETLKAQGAHIDGEPGVGYVLRPGFMLPPLMFSEEEIEAIVLGSRWVADRADAALGSAARNALAKIAAVLPQDLKVSLDTSSLLVGPGHAVAAGDAELPTIRLAIRTERKLRIFYVDGRGRDSKRTIWPFALAFFDRVRVVVAW